MGVHFAISSQGQWLPTEVSVELADRTPCCVPQDHQTAVTGICILQKITAHPCQKCPKLLIDVGLGISLAWRSTMECRAWLWFQNSNDKNKTLSCHSAMAWSMSRWRWPSTPTEAVATTERLCVPHTVGPPENSGPLPPPSRGNPLFLPGESWQVSTPEAGAVAWRAGWTGARHPWSRAKPACSPAA